MGIGDILLLVAGGLLGGAINAIAGGGSLVVFPALLATGMNPLQANVTNSVGQVPGYIGGVIGFWPDLKDQQNRMRQVVPVAALGSVVGCALLLLLPSEAFDAIVPVLVLLAAVMLYFQPRLKQYAARRTTGNDAPRWELYALIFLAAAYGGYFGGALGVILLAVLSLTSPDTLRRNNALKTAISTTAGLVTVVAFGLFAPVDWWAALIIAPAAMLGGVVGAKIARRIPENALRWTVIVLSVAVAAYLAVRALRGG